MGKWEAVIGLEVHVQLDTRSKAFSSSQVAYGGVANSQTDPTVLGLPGALPVFNDVARLHAVRLGLALGCTIRRESRFARKHYFYPDLPKGYQISQFSEPICEGGAVEILSAGGCHRVPLTRIHLEEDAGKSMHRPGYSLVDLNRAGVALCEVVSEPAIRSAAEAADYLRSLRQVVRYLNVSGGDMEKGQLRCDANVSVRPKGQRELGTRTELKNINSFKFVEKAINHEVSRQIGLLEAGKSVVLETRLWDSDAGLSRSMRKKEESVDYRYFPDPDLPPLCVSEETCAAIQKELPELPAAAYRRLVSLGVSDSVASSVIASPAVLAYFDDVCQGAPAVPAKLVANWVQGDLMGHLNAQKMQIEDCPVSPNRLSGLVSLLHDGAIGASAGKKVLGIMLTESGAEAKDIVEAHGFAQTSDISEVEALVERLIEAHPKEAASYRGGNTKVLGYFVGKVLKEVGGKANPKEVNEILRAKLSAHGTD